MKISCCVGLVAACVLFPVLGFLMSGCETNSDGTTALTVEPSYVNLSGSNSVGVTQTFTVTDGLGTLSLPLTWSVRNPALGSVSAAGGYSASYVRTGRSGDNAITVRDQYGAEGVATIRQ